MSKAKHEGYLLIDHRNSPGVSEELIRASNKPFIITKPDQLFESATVTCSHCGVIVVLNPDRTRPRGYCAKCDHYVCDNPGCGLECRPFKKLIEELQNDAVNSLAPQFIPFTSLSLPISVQNKE